MVEPRRRRAPALLAAVLLGASCLPGCGSDGPPSAASATQPPAELRIGDATLRATAIATAGLGQPIATRYGVDRERGTILLTVGLVRAGAGGETSVPGRIRATRVDLLGRRSDIPLRALENGAQVEYVGSTRAGLPDTLRFEVEAVRDGMPAATLRFHRDFF